MKDHQYLEDDIARFYVIKDHVKLLTEQYIDSPRYMTQDEMWNQLAAIDSMLELYIEKAMDTYCQVFELNEYATPEQKAYREQFLSTFNKSMEAGNKAGAKTKKKVKK
jgi:hypothetical protein